MYADAVTPSMRAAMDETERRRRKQDAFNKAHGIVPKTIVKPVHDILEISESEASNGRKRQKKLSDRERREEIAKLEKQMREASKMLEFEYAAVLRDRIIALRGEEKENQSISGPGICGGNHRLCASASASLWRLWHKDKKAVLPGAQAALLRLGGIGCMLLSVCLAQLVSYWGGVMKEHHRFRLCFRRIDGGLDQPPVPGQRAAA